jgi:hypothetical protein
LWKTAMMVVRDQKGMGKRPKRNDHTTMSQLHQPTCEPVLAGVDGGADDHGGTTNENVNRGDDRENTTMMAKIGGW